MKVYVVEAFTAEVYESDTWVHGVYSTKEKAQAVIKGFGREVQNQDLENYEYGWLIIPSVREFEVQ